MYSSGSIFEALSGLTRKVTAGTTIPMQSSQSLLYAVLIDTKLDYGGHKYISAMASHSGCIKAVRGSLDRASSWALLLS
jgi:hypothetical protein